MKAAAVRQGGGFQRFLNGGSRRGRRGLHPAEAVLPSDGQPVDPDPVRPALAGFLDHFEPRGPQRLGPPMNRRGVDAVPKSRGVGPGGQSRLEGRRPVPLIGRQDGGIREQFFGRQTNAGAGKEFFQGQGVPGEDVQGATVGFLHPGRDHRGGASPGAQGGQQAGGVKPARHENRRSGAPSAAFGQGVLRQGVVALQGRPAKGFHGGQEPREVIAGKGGRPAPLRRQTFGHSEDRRSPTLVDRPILRRHGAVQQPRRQRPVGRQGPHRPFPVVGRPTADQGSLGFLDFLQQDDAANAFHGADIIQVVAEGGKGAQIDAGPAAESPKPVKKLRVGDLPGPVGDSLGHQGFQLVGAEGSSQFVHEPPAVGVDPGFVEAFFPGDRPQKFFQFRGRLRAQSPGEEPRVVRQAPGAPVVGGDGFVQGLEPRRIGGFLERLEGAPQVFQERPDGRTLRHRSPGGGDVGAIELGGLHPDHRQRPGRREARPFGAAQISGGAEMLRRRGQGRGRRMPPINRKIHGSRGAFHRGQGHAAFGQGGQKATDVFLRRVIGVQILHQQNERRAGASRRGLPDRAEREHRGRQIKRQGQLGQFRRGGDGGRAGAQVRGKGRKGRRGGLGQERRSLPTPGGLAVLPEAFFGGVNGENVRKNVDRRQKGGDAFPREKSSGKRILHGTSLV